MKGTPQRGWKHFPHGADLGICGIGPSPEAAFEEAAAALTAAITATPVAANEAIALSCEAGNIELLFVAWLNALIYEMAVRQMLFGRFDVHIAGRDLRATAWGEPIDRAKHEPACEPKGATFTALKVVPDADGLWSACCVVDV